MLFNWASGDKAYTVHEKPFPAAMKGDRAEELVFVKDGFSLFAAFAPPLWMIFNRLWLVLAGYLTSILGLVIVFGVLGIADFWLSYASLAFSIIIGFEADSLTRWTLDRRCWRQIAHITGPNSDECERRFFDSWLPTIPEISPDRLTSPALPRDLEDTTKLQSSPDDAETTKSKRWYNLFYRES